MTQRLDQSHRLKDRDIVEKEILRSTSRTLGQSDPRSGRLALVLNATPYCSDQCEDDSRCVYPQILLCGVARTETIVLVGNGEQYFYCNDDEEEDKGESEENAPLEVERSPYQRLFSRRVDLLLLDGFLGRS